MRKFLLVLSIVLAVPAPLLSQFKIDLGDGRELTVTDAAQFWDIVSLQMNAPGAVDKRNDVCFRRGRLGVEGMLRPDMLFNVTLAYDGIGKDPYTPTAGTANAGDNRDLYIWEASWIWSFAPDLSWLINNDKFKISLDYIWGKRYDKIPFDDLSYLSLGMQLLY